MTQVFRLLLKTLIKALLSVPCLLRLLSTCHIRYYKPKTERSQAKTKPTLEIHQKKKNTSKCLSNSLFSIFAFS